MSQSRPASCPNKVLNDKQVVLFYLKKYGCGACGSTFTDRFDLIEHAEKVHDKKTTYKCITCEEFFSSEPSFKLHMIRNHKIV